jgi:hypothetical protein
LQSNADIKLHNATHDSWSSQGEFSKYFFASNNQNLSFTDVSWQQLGGFSKQRKEWGWGIIVVLLKDQRQEVRVRSVVDARDEINWLLKAYYRYRSCMAFCCVVCDVLSRSFIKKWYI